MFGGFSESKLKPSLKMAVSRFEIVSNKKRAIMKQQMGEISKLLKENPPQEEKAAIRGEALIRDDDTIEAYEILQLSCELLSERIKLITSTKQCPPDLVTSIATLIFASNRVDNVPELNDIRKQFKKKYGKQFEQDALNNVNGVCNERVVAKLSVQPPSGFLVQTYLETIAKQYDVDWTPQNKVPAEKMAEPMAAPVGYSVQVAPGTGLAPTQAYTVNSNSKDDDDSKSNNGGGGASAYASAPPMESAPSLPSSPPPVIPVIPPPAPGYEGRSSAASVASMSTLGQGSVTQKPSTDSSIPVAEVMPMGGRSTFDKYDDAVEPDIAIPPAAPGYEHHKSSSDINEGGEGKQFDDLQARFANLKK